MSNISASSTVDAANPWLGLASFTEETRGYFHGRDEDAAELARRVQRKLLTVLFGQSGHGKTSLLRAGLVPRLRDEAYCPVYVRLDYAAESPAPAEQIKQAIFQATLAAGSWTQTGASVRGESLWEFLHHRDDTLKDASGRTLVPLLIFDQFEEIFTLAQNDDTGRERAHRFLADLADLVENRPPLELERRIEREEADAAKFDFARGDYRILISLREDYLAHLEGLKSQMPSVTQNRVRLARFNGSQALLAVRAPAPDLVSEEVATQIVRFVAGGADVARAEVEPSLLSLICRELNNTRLTLGHPEITADLLAGSRETILSEFYENALSDQPAGVRRFIEDELLTDSGYRESVAEERVKKAFAAAGGNPDVLAFLVGRRLLRVEERLDVRRVELTHDVLCSVVKASREVRQEREGKEALERQLAATRATEEATRRSLRRARLVAIGCALLAMAAIGSAVFGYTNLRRAQISEKAATMAEERAANALARAEDVLGFMLIDLPEQLSDAGQAAILRDVAEKAVAYYERLPAALRTPATIARHGWALATFGRSLRGEPDLAQARFEEALALFEREEKKGPISPEMRLAYGNTLAGFSRLMDNRARFGEQLTLGDRAVRTLAPLVADGQVNGPAQGILAQAQVGRGRALSRNGRKAESIQAFEEALEAAQRAEDTPPKPRHPGLLIAGVSNQFSVALVALGEPVRARQVAAPVRGIIEELLAREPDLFAARQLAAGAAFSADRDAWQEWDEPAGSKAQQEVVATLSAEIRRDPSGRGSRNNLAVATFSELFFRRANADWTRFEQLVRETDPRFDSNNEGSFMRGNHARFLITVAQDYAALGRSQQADTYLAAARREFATFQSELATDSAERVLREADDEAQARRVEMARLNYAEAKKTAAATLAKLSSLAAGTGQETQLSRQKAAAYLTLGQIAFNAGDYDGAYAAYSSWRLERSQEFDSSTKQGRADQAGTQLEWARVLAKVNRLDEARAAFEPARNEAESLFSDRPDLFITQRLLANSLRARVDVEPNLPASEKRTLLERAAGIYRKADSEGRLTRFEKEIVLKDIETELGKVSQ